MLTGRNDKSVFFDIQFLLLALIVLTLPFSINLNSFLIVITSVNSLIIFTKFSWCRITKGDYLSILRLTTPFIIYTLVFFLSWNLSYWYAIEKKFSLLVFPFIFALGKVHLSRKQVDVILDGFVVSTFIATVFTLLNSGAAILRPEMIGQNLVIDRPYFGMYVLFCVFLLIYKISKTSDFATRVLIITLMVYFVFFSILILAKIALIGFLITILVALVFYFLQLGQFGKILLVVSVSFAFGIAIFFFNPTFASNIVKIVKFEPFDLSNGQWIYYLSVNTRMAIWDCSWQLLSREHNWLTGCGLDHQLSLNLCNNLNWSKYNVNTFEGIEEAFLASNFDSHSEYLNIWLDTGLIGLAGFLLCLVWSFRIAYKAHNFLHIAFLTFFGICCLTESLLARQKGIVFFALFNSLFLFYRSSLVFGKMK